MEHLYEKALESAEYIKTHTKKRPKIAVVLGSGLGKLTADFTDTEELSYKDIPNFPVSTVAGHKGALLAGKLGDTEVYAMEGRFHFRLTAPYSEERREAARRYARESNAADRLK